MEPHPNWAQLNPRAAARARRELSDLGRLLVAHRAARRLSQSQLAALADFDHSYVSRIESGDRMPTREAVGRLADALHLSQVARDELIAAAGFLPGDVTSLLSDEPVVAAVLALLRDEAVSRTYRESIRQVLHALAGVHPDELAQLAEVTR